MNEGRWENLRVYGRDEVLRDIESQAHAYYSDRVIKDVREIMNDYEVDLYRIIISVGRRYGMDIAYEIMSDTVIEKRLKWLNQRMCDLTLSGTDLEKGLELLIKYFKPKKEEFEILEKSDQRIVFRRKEFVNAISHACNVLGLDLMEVSNKIYARATNYMLERINPALRYVVLNYKNGWYEEMIEFNVEKNKEEE